MAAPLFLSIYITWVVRWTSAAFGNRATGYLGSRHPAGHLNTEQKEVNKMIRIALRYTRYAFASLATVAFRLAAN